MRPGETVVLRATEEHVRVVAVIDASGTLLVELDDARFEVARDDLAHTWERHADCGCCL